jgi:hypothetical protein
MDLAVKKISQVPPLRVHVHGFSHFATQFPELLGSEGWEIRAYGTSGAGTLAAKLADLRRADLAFTYGGRTDLGKFLGAARVLGKKKVVIFWAGSDILWAKKDFAAGKKMNSWVTSRIHWAAAPWIAEEVRSIGLDCEYVSVNWAAAVPSPSPLPTNMSVLTYMPDLERAELYGLEHILKVAAALPSIKFTVVGFRPPTFPAAPPNLTVHGWVANMTPFYEQATVLWRPVQHDGMSFMVLSALAHGRHVLWSYEFPGCTKSVGADEAMAQLLRLQLLHEKKDLPLNVIGMELIGKEFSREKTRGRILDRWAQIIRARGRYGPHRVIANLHREASGQRHP